MINAKKISNRRKGRQTAESFIHLILDEVREETNVDWLGAFWEALRTAFPEELAKPQPSKEFKPMTEEENLEFDKKTMPFGKFKGMVMKEIDLGYLEWFAEQPDEFKVEVQRYLASERIQREMRGQK